jgi:hypothetical protein
MPDGPTLTAPSSVTFADLLRHHRTAAGLTSDAISTLERGARRRPRKGWPEAASNLWNTWRIGTSHPPAHRRPSSACGTNCTMSWLVDAQSRARPPCRRYVRGTSPGMA